jgi:hypothetical protein
MQPSYPREVPPGPPLGFAPHATPVKAPRILGILSIIFSSLVIVFTLFGLVAGNSMMGFTDRRMTADMDRYMETIRTPNTIQGIVFLLMAAALLWIGIGQLKYRRWAARASVIWGALGLLCVVAMIVNWYMFTGPAMSEFMTAVARRTGGPDIGAVFGPIMVFFLAACYTPYPIVLMAAFSRPRVKAAMQN